MRGLHHKYEILFCFGLTAFCLLISVMSIYLGFGRVKSPGPGFFPAFTSITGIVFGIFTSAHYLSSKKQAEPGKKMFEKGQMRRFLALIATFCAWLLLMPWLGFVLMTFFATLAFAKIMGLEGWWKPVFLAIGGAVFIYLLFDVWFYADLPRGFLG